MDQWAPGAGVSERNKGKGKWGNIFGVDVLHLDIVGVHISIYIFVITYWTVHLKWVHFIDCKLNLNIKKDKHSSRIESKI